MRYITRKLESVSDILIVSGNIFFFFASISPKLNFFDNFANSKAFPTVFTLLGNCFSDLFIEVEVLYLKNFKFVLGRFLDTQNKL